MPSNIVKYFIPDGMTPVPVSQPEIWQSIDPGLVSLLPPCLARPPYAQQILLRAIVKLQIALISVM
ncbi:hypothetical protein SAMN05216308_11079 [Nitrosospira sp. Nsp13]|nr:hypothetical protein SAMN05216308_11079 [Nitrosospira sp. Nsp13]